MRNIDRLIDRLIVKWVRSERGVEESSAVISSFEHVKVMMMMMVQMMVIMIQ